MYNFRYHLVTICSIFLALALGVLLGVAVAGTDLVKETSDDMVASLMTSFDELNAENDNLSQELGVQRPFALQLVGAWTTNRLQNRTVVLIGAEGDELIRRLGKTVSDAGGLPIYVYIQPDQALFPTEPDELAAVQQIIPPVDGEDYKLTLTNVLIDEWTSGFQPTEDAPTPALAETYPLTHWLVEQGHISVTVDYSALLTQIAAANELSPQVASQREALIQAQQLQLPFAVNGFIDASVMPIENSTEYQADQDSLLLALAFEQRGREQKLPWFDWSGSQGTLVAEGSDTITDEDIEQASYFVVLTQTDSKSAQLVQEAENNDLSAVITPTSSTGIYSLVALLSGGESGIYGMQRDQGQNYPPLPVDSRGDAVFRQ
ncbi:MAG: copper transporter [Coriobacteriales bacterium]|jgi:hypothetical protein|nr:copper transporter [Coriobacteriales bacterium]